MTEQLRKSYGRLFEIRLLHHYWLDEEAVVFDALSSEKKNQRLAAYDRRPFLSIQPASSTIQRLEQLECLYRDTALGCVVFIPREYPVPADAVFDFAVTVREETFFNYTAFTLGPQNIWQHYYPPENRLYRFKSNVPFLSNTTGTARGGALFLSREFPDAADDSPVESIYTSGETLRQLTSSQPGANSQQISPSAAASPVYLHQGDIPDIVPPRGLSGAPQRGILLADGIPDEVFVFIHLETLPAAGSDFSLVDIAGHPRAEPPVFQVRFKNRSTFWRYHNLKTGTVFTGPEVQALTHFGAGPKRKPSDGPVKAETSGNRITQLISDIYE
jgi:hypothetical protein